MKASEVLMRAMQISGIPNVDENKAKLVLAFKEKLEQYGMGLSIREIEETGLRVSKEIQASMRENQTNSVNKQTLVEDAVEIPMSKGSEA